MAKNTYQSYTADTPIRSFRNDFLRRGGMCSALASRISGLAAIANEAKTIVSNIDSRLDNLQAAEDAELYADALADAEKIDVIDIYTELRRTMFAQKADVATILPDAPSSLARLGADSFTKRTEIAIAALKALPETDSIRTVFLANLEQEFSEFNAADKAEDSSSHTVKTIRLALTLYKSELAQTREAQLGSLLTILKDRQKVALFTLPWRRSSRPSDDETTAEPTPTPVTQFVPQPPDTPSSVITTRSSAVCKRLCGTASHPLSRLQATLRYSISPTQPSAGDFAVLHLTHSDVCIRFCGTASYALRRLRALSRYRRSLLCRMMSHFSECISLLQVSANVSGGIDVHDSWICVCARGA